VASPAIGGEAAKFGYRQLARQRRHSLYAQNVLSHICLCVCLSVMLYFLKALSEKVQFCCAGTSSECLGPVRVSRSSRKGRGHRSSSFISFSGSEFRMHWSGMYIFGMQVQLRTSRSSSCIKIIRLRSTSQEHIFSVYPVCR